MRIINLVPEKALYREKYKINENTHNSTEIKIGFYKLAMFSLNV